MYKNFSVAQISMCICTILHQGARLQSFSHFTIYLSHHCGLFLYLVLFFVYFKVPKLWKTLIHAALEVQDSIAMLVRRKSVRQAGRALTMA